MSLIKIRQSSACLQYILAVVLLTTCLGVDFTHQHAFPLIAFESSGSGVTDCDQEQANQPESLICHACVFSTSIVDAGYSYSHVLDYTPEQESFTQIVHFSPAVFYSSIYRLRAPPFHPHF